MYCRECGEFTENESGLCDACDKKSGKRLDDIVVENGIPVGGAGDKPGKMYGFGSALASVIVGVIACIISVVQLELAAISLLLNVGEEVLNDGNPVESLVVSVSNAVSFVVLMASVAMAVIALVSGIRSIRRFREAKALGIKPVATLVLGIVGTVTAGTTLLMSVADFFILLVSLLFIY